MPIQAVVFDAYGTLFNVHSAVDAVADNLGDKKQTVSNYWRDKQLQYTWLRSLMGDYVDFWQVTRDALSFAFDQCELHNEELKEQLMNAYLHLKTYEEVPSILSTLKATNIKTAILSNGSPMMLAAATKSASIDDKLDAVLSVDSLQLYKPDQRVYALATQQFSCEAQDICFVSSNAWDVAGAAHFGFQVAWVNRFSQAAERLSVPPRWQLKDLIELPDLLS